MVSSTSSCVQTLLCSNIIALTEKVSMALDSGKIVGGVFLDLKKAFDCVSHDILLNKLYAYGIRGSLIQWFQSYLSARSQFVFYNGIRSSIRNITHGVPQGSILGPLLFILNVNDFSRSSDLLFSILFADDTSVFIEGHSYAEVIEILNNELLKVSDWLMANKLTINLEKSHYMIFHRSRLKDCDKKDVIIQDRIISHVTSTKFLGVIIDDKLKWNLHILYMKNKIAKSNGILYKIRNFLDRKTLSHLYNSFVFPYLIYGIEVWGNTNAVHLDPIIKIQKKIVRTITFSHYLAHTEPIFDTLNILNFNNLVVHRISLMMFKYSKDLVPLPIVELFTRNYEFHNHFTRQSQSLHTAVGRNEAIYKTFTFHGIRIWNYISTKISVDVSYASFKHSSKLFIKSNPIPYRIT